MLKKKEKLDQHECLRMNCSHGTVLPVDRAQGVVLSGFKGALFGGGCHEY